MLPYIVTDQLESFAEPRFIFLDDILSFLLLRNIFFQREKSCKLTLLVPQCLALYPDPVTAVFFCITKQFAVERTSCSDGVFEIGLGFLVCVGAVHEHAGFFATNFLKC